MPGGGGGAPPAGIRLRTRARRILAVVLVVASCAASAAAVPGAWARRNLLDTDRFVQRMEAALDDPAVQEALAERLTEEVVVLVEPGARLAGVLPEAGQVLVEPLTVAFEGWVHDRVAEVVASDAFAELWATTVRVAHGGAVRVLRGEGRAAGIDGELVALDLVPAVELVLDELAPSSPLVPGREASGAAVGAGEARERLEARFQVQLPEGFARPVVYDGTKLRAAQQALEAFDRLLVGLLVVTGVAAAGALAVSDRRRRTLAQLSLGVAVAMALVRRGALLVEGQVVELAERPGAAVAVESVVGALVAPLTTFAAWSVAAGLVVAVVLALAGPGERAIRSRAWIAALGRPAARDARASDGRRRGDVDVVLVGAALVVIGALVLLDLTAGWLVALLGATGVVVVVLHRSPATLDEGAAPTATGRYARATRSSRSSEK